ncbi:hypothetical protein [Rhizobium sp.]
MTKIILAATAAIIATLSFATVSEAGWRHRNNFGLTIVVDAGPRYVARERYVSDCYWVRKEKINRYGELVNKKIQVCD